MPDSKVEDPIWTVNLAHAFLMTNGWDLSRIVHITSDDELQLYLLALDATAPAHPEQAALLTNGVVNALLHWPFGDVQDFCGVLSGTVEAVGDTAADPSQH